MTSARLFAYGTLLVPDVLEGLLGRCVPGRVAVLPGYARFRVRGELYPAIVARPGASVTGLVYEGLDAADWATLDAYEGGCYRRVPVRVLARGAWTSADVYELGAGQHGLLSPEAWDLEWFRAARRAALGSGA